MKRMVPNALERGSPGLSRRNSPVGARRFVVPLLLLAVLFAAAVALQSLAGAYAVDLSGYPDETGHFVTGVLVQDYLSKIPPPPLVPFAKEFYIHRPKVAIGHWPPLMYLIEGIWFILFHATRQSALALMALISASVAASIGYIVRSRFGITAGIAAGLLFLGLSFVQAQTSEVMADMLVTLFGFWATVAFADFLTDKSLRDILRFAAFALLAIFTKNNGLYLALTPPIAILFTRQFKVLRSPLLWLGGALVAVPTAAWVGWSHKYVTNSWVEKPGIEFFLRASRADLFFIYLILGPCLLMLLAAGVVRESIRVRSSRDFLPLTLLAAVLSVILFQSIAPAGIEPRFLLPAVASMIPVVFSGLLWIADAIRLRAVPMWIRATVLLAIAILLSPHSTFAIPHKPYRGFPEVADYIQSQPALREGAVLVSSASDGEGLLIAEVAMRYPSSEGFLLRASKMLAQSDWLGRDYKGRFLSADEVFRYMDELKVDLIVIDDLPGIAPPKHQELLLRMCQDHPESWRPVPIRQPRPLDLDGARIFVFQRVGSSDPSGDKIHRDMEEILRRMIGE